MTTLTIDFNSRDTYIAWRTTWRAEYKAISQQIRDCKVALKKAQQANSRFLWKEHSDLFKARKEANTLLDLRVKSKIEAGIQYTAQKECKTCN